MFGDVYREVLCILDPKRSPDEWRRIFNYEWSHPEDYSGYVLIDDGVIVAFLGLVFADTVIDGRTERLCNVTSWVAKEPYQSEAAGLVLELRRLKYTITNLSCNTPAFKVFSKLGFKVLETHKRVFVTRPLLGAGPVRQALTDPDDVAGCLDEADSQIFRDHLPYAKHLVIASSRGYCYVVYTLGQWRHLPLGHIHYVSDRREFLKNLGGIQQALWARHRVFLAECDERLLAGARIPWSYKRPLKIPRLFKSSRVQREGLSNLYSEVVLLNLS